MHMRKASLACMLFLAALSTRTVAGTLFIGSDTEDFAGTLPDHLLKAVVTGAAFNGLTTINLDFHLTGFRGFPRKHPLCRGTSQQYSQNHRLQWKPFDFDQRAWYPEQRLLQRGASVQRWHVVSRALLRRD